MTDVLTDVLRTLRLRVGLLGRGEFCNGAPLDFTALDKAVFHLVGRGPVWLHCRLYAEPVELNEGDILFLPQPQWHKLSPTPQIGQLDATAGDPSTKSLVCCTVEFESTTFDPILSALPPVLIGHCRDEAASGALASVARLVLSEYDGTTPGYQAMRERLAEALLIQLLRYYMRTQTELRGLLRGLIDPQLARALAAMHAVPGRDWDVDTLAGEAHMSRSTFARRFGECMGTSPMDYLCAWRMHLAEQMLRDRRQSVAKVAEALGYKTEAAFRHAFKRARGIGPGEIRRAVRAVKTAN